MAYAVNLLTRKAGLDILRGQQPQSSQARNIISQFLEHQIDPILTISALNALATPGAAEPAQRARLMKQFRDLTTHLDPVVRRHSLSMLSRWGETQYANDLSNVKGLTDTDSRLRTVALLSLANTDYPDAVAYNALLRVIEDSSESALLCSNALFGLRKYGISAEEDIRFQQLIDDTRY